jgi:hypothetical protein
MRTARRLACAALLALLVVGCASSFDRARSEFRQARYAETRVRLVALEPEVKEWSSAQQAQYALYRGLTHEALGDRAASEPWLRRAKKAWDQDRTVFNDDDATRLRLAMEALDAPASSPMPPAP